MHKKHREDYLTAALAGLRPMHLGRLIVKAAKARPKDAIFVRDSDATSIYTWTYAQVTPRGSIWNQNFGHLRTGLPYAISAKLVVGKDRRVVLISGDSALFHTSELEKAVRNNLPLICMVACDLCLGRGSPWVSRNARRVTRNDAHWSKQLRLDKVAEGYGAHGEYVERGGRNFPQSSALWQVVNRHNCKYR